MNAALLAAAAWAWDVLRSLTVTDWLLVLLVLGLWGVSAAVRWGFAALIGALEPVIEHYRAVEAEREERKTNAGSATRSATS